MTDLNTVASPLVFGASLEQAAAWFFENSSDGFAISRSGRILSVNSAWCRICKCTPERAVGQTGLDLVHPDELLSYQRSEGVIRAKGVGTFENRMRTGDCDWVWVRTSVKRGPDGYAMIVIHDISAERAQIEEAANAAKARELLRSAAGVFTWRFNPLTKMYVIDTGFTTGGLSAAPGTEVSQEEMMREVHPDDLARFLVARRQSNRTGEPGELWYRLARSDGTWSSLRTSWRGLQRCNNGEYEILGITQDMTEIVEARDAALRGEEAAKRADEMKSQFLANISHEIRTPLNGVLGVLHILEAEPLAPETQILVKEAIACGGMLTTLLNDILDLSWIEGGQATLSPVPVDAAEAVGGVAQLFRPQLEAKGLYMRTSAPALSGPIWVDATRLRQALHNLISNAVKFTKRGGVSIRLTGRGLAENHRLRIEVEDTGIGISQTAQEQLFKRFHQLDGSNTRQFGGTGLGLAIASRLAALMDGELGVQSAIGRGSTFWLDIAAPLVVTEQGQTDDAKNPLESFQILIVDDNPMNRRIGSILLESLGASVETADNGQLGVEALLRRHFDLVFMDIQMPVMDGVEATRLIRSIPGPGGQTPILAMTANVLPDQLASYEEAGMDGVVAKPLSPTAIISEVARLMASKPGNARMAEEILNAGSRALGSGVHVRDHIDHSLIDADTRIEAKMKAILSDFGPRLTTARIEDLRGMFHRACDEQDGENIFSEIWQRYRLLPSSRMLHAESSSGTPFAAELASIMELVWTSPLVVPVSDRKESAQLAGC